MRDSVMPPPPRMVTRPSYSEIARVRRPARGPDAVGEVAQPGQRQRQRVLGHGLGVDPLAACPHVVVVEHAGLDVELDAGPRQLHPAGVGARLDQRLQAVDVVGMPTPHDRLGLVGLDEYATPGLHGSPHPVRARHGTDHDSGRRGHDC